MILGMPQDPIQLDDVKLDKVANMRNFMDNNFASKVVAKDAGITNTTANRKRIEEFLRVQYTNAVSGQYNSFWNLAPNTINNDQITVFFAEQVIKEFKPELLVVNMQDVDTCHQNFTRYANNIRKADYAVAKLWEAIQSTPGMANDTILIVAPEHGRNLQPNTIRDVYGRYAIDHTSDPTSREIFCLIAGPPSKVKQNQLITQELGESIDIVPTIARILGFDTDIPAGRLQGRHLGEAFN
jgi:membrane-anchored protein YejM (alkaline phosphatase superfamily)